MLLENTSGRSRKSDGKVELIIEPMDAKVIGDVNQLRFLFENLIDEALAVREEGVIRLQARKDNEYIRFLLRIPDARRV